MFPRGFTQAVPPAGIVTESGEHVDKCFKYDTTYQGSETQTLYRSHRLGDPGVRMHVPGVSDSEPPSNLVFGVTTPANEYTTRECLKTEPEQVTEPFKNYLDAQENMYLRSKNKLGKVPDGVAQIPPELYKTGFGVSTKFGESAGQIIQNTRQSLPNDISKSTGYQTNRNYNWKMSKINPITHTFGIRCTGNIDHLNELMNHGNDTYVIPTAVDRAEHSAIVPDPDPLNPKINLTRRTLRASEVLGKRDPSNLPPAGVVTRASDFSIGDTISEMGCMDAFDTDFQPLTRDFNPADDLVHGVPTKPNPFPNPLRGPGRYANLGLSDEDFLKLRDRPHIVPIMITALALTEDEANNIFDQVSRKYHRDKISVSEFHEAFKSYKK